MFRGLDISGSGLTAERLRMDVIASNVANASSTRSDQGGAYKRLVAVLEARGGSYGSLGEAGFSGAGVRVSRVIEDPSPLRLVYDPTHPDARPDGYVEMPNVNPVMEMVDLIAAARAYEANVTVLNASKQMAMKALDIGRA